MTLYLYKTGTNAPVLTIENVQSYMADSVTALDTEGMTVTYAPLAADCELSSKADCSETLRAAWREANPDGETRLDELEEENKLLKQQVSALTDQNDFQEELIVELANVVYA